MIQQTEIHIDNWRMYTTNGPRNKLKDRHSGISGTLLLTHDSAAYVATACDQRIVCSVWHKSADYMNDGVVLDLQLVS